MSAGSGDETERERIDRLQRQVEDDAEEIRHLREQVADHEAIEREHSQEAERKSELIRRLRSEAGVRDAALKEIREMLLSIEIELDDLRAVRDALTPAELAPRPGLELHATFLPSTHRVSGDFYLATDGAAGSTVVVVGDVAGKGPEAARDAAFLRTAFVSVAPFSSDPCQLLQWVNIAYGERSGFGQRYATAVCVMHDADGDRVRWARAGHPPPVRLFSGEELRAGRHGTPLGAREVVSCIPGSTVLEEHEGLLLYTDGLSEARTGGEQYGPGRIGAIIRRMADAPVTEIAGELQRSATAFGGGELSDDLCIVTLQSA